MQSGKPTRLPKDVKYQSWKCVEATKDERQVPGDRYYWVYRMKSRKSHRWEVHYEEYTLKKRDGEAPETAVARIKEIWNLMGGDADELDVQIEYVERYINPDDQQRPVDGYFPPWSVRMGVAINDRSPAPVCRECLHAIGFPRDDQVRYHKPNCPQKNVAHPWSK